uniref:Olfactory receptor n=1 Tax=Chrysemys picta bellii TaxID=8478 RepID=A0A8C3I421_CHRPI
MSTVNDTKFQFAVFLLTGLHGQEDFHLWISIPFCFMYVISILGNSVILFIIKTDPSLHEPMYIFLSMLAITELGISITTMPTILGIFLFNSREISLDACLAQLFFIHSLQCIESSVLLLMAFDRFIAICNPLRYASILTLPRIPKMGLVCVLRGVAIILPLPLFLHRFQYCRANVLSHSYCLFQEVMKMACSDISVNSIYGLFTKLLTLGLDSLLIFLSYVMILKTVLSIVAIFSLPTKDARLKALETCSSHLCAILSFYIPGLFSSLTHRFGHNVPLYFHVLIVSVYLLVPPMLNPIIYGVRTKQIQDRLLWLFTHKGI